MLPALAALPPNPPRTAPAAVARAFDPVESALAGSKRRCVWLYGRVAVWLGFGSARDHIGTLAAAPSSSPAGGQDGGGSAGQSEELGAELGAHEREIHRLEVRRVARVDDAQVRRADLAKLGMWGGRDERAPAAHGGAGAGERGGGRCPTPMIPAGTITAIPTDVDAGCALARRRRTRWWRPWHA